MDFLEPSSVTTTEMIVRLLLAAGAGLVMGLDRDIKNKPVDFRAYMIVCAASVLLAIMSMEMAYTFQDENTIYRLDPTRIVQGILTGIGFLGAGAIIQRKDQVVGSATGASIWASGGLGLCIGYGYYGLALAAFLIIAIVLVVLGWMRKNLLHEHDEGV